MQKLTTEQQLLTVVSFMAKHCPSTPDRDEVIRRMCRSVAGEAFSHLNGEAQSIHTRQETDRLLRDIKLRGLMR